jgi:hypothetical protein
MNALAPIADKLGKLIRYLSSDKDGEVLAAVHAIRRTLHSEKLDIHVLADGITGANGHNGRDRKYTEEDMVAAYRSGRDDGRKEAERNGGFYSVDEPGWHQIARECQKHVDQLRDREREFVEDMVCRTVHGGELTEKQAKWLRDIWTRMRRV